MIEQTEHFCIVRNAPEFKQGLIQRAEQKTGKVMKGYIKRSLLALNWRELYYELMDWIEDNK
ncbi:MULTISPECIES: hypothetical protein [unclassified Lactococcus]|uniref:hypothetical protein n=1 Tax=unclassified Lactococcus TaxID=2643510 RepID=UPI0011CC6123|nr:MULTISPECIES: hypothetical protein [unclassified Lactococcus]MQW23905.1 hypothetical protein [Lactococcus sp. dk101]TXK37133.1 hypothetical protein FVP42_09795 [Lactococcus sp. dk310]TXK47987.1 hypothetical protein FVP43_09520 [Lactococcus sp. dk322]